MERAGSFGTENSALPVNQGTMSQVRLGNDLARNVGGGGPGTGRTVYRTGYRGPMAGSLVLLPRSAVRYSARMGLKRQATARLFGGANDRTNTRVVTLYCDMLMDAQDRKDRAERIVMPALTAREGEQSLTHRAPLFSQPHPASQRRAAPTNRPAEAT